MTTAEARKQAARKELAKNSAATVDHNRGDIGEVLIHMDYADCDARFESTITDEVITFKGPKDKHSLSLLVTDRERALAHWHGFAENNGGGWAKIRRHTHSDSNRCDHCNARLESGQYIVAADFGSFCSGACAESEREELEDV